MTTPEISSPVLLAGGTGRTGARIAQRLAERGVPVRIGSRRGASDASRLRPSNKPMVAAMQDAR